MVEHIHLFQTLGEYKEARENGYVKPWGSLILENRRVNYNKTDEEKLLEIPLTFEIQGNGNIVWKKATTATTVENVIEYSKNGGEWTSITANTTGGTVISVVSGDKGRDKRCGFCTVFQCGRRFFKLAGQHAGAA